MTQAAASGDFQTLYPFPDHFLDQEGHRYHYLDEGQGEVLLLLHGNPTWSFFYRNLVLAFRDRYRLVVPDHMGCGFSDKPADYPYTLDRHILNVYRLVETLKLERITLVVHDWGGAIGMGLATRFPEKIRRMVLLNTAAFTFPWMPWRIRMCRIPLLGAFLVRALNGFARAALRMAVRKPLLPAVRAGYLKPYDSWSHRVAIYRFVQDIPMHPSHPSWDCLVAIERALPCLAGKPILILWGGRDFCFNLRFLNRWRSLYPSAEVHVFENAGHYVLEDAGEPLIQALRAFLEKTP